MTTANVINPSLSWTVLKLLVLLHVIILCNFTNCLERLQIVSSSIPVLDFVRSHNIFLATMQWYHWILWYMNFVLEHTAAVCQWLHTKPSSFVISHVYMIVVINISLCWYQQQTKYYSEWLTVKYNNTTNTEAAVMATVDYSSGNTQLDTNF